LKTAYATIKGFELMRALRKGRAAIFNLAGDIRREARIVERAFGIGPSTLTEIVAILQQNFDAKPSWLKRMKASSQPSGIFEQSPLKSILLRVLWGPCSMLGMNSRFAGDG